MDQMQMQQEEQAPELGADDVIIELLTELVEQGRAKRAEGVMAPPMEEAPPPAGDDEMAELEQMMAEPPPEAMPPVEEPPPKKPEDEDELE